MNFGESCVLSKWMGWATVGPWWTEDEMKGKDTRSSRSSH